MQLPTIIGIDLGKNSCSLVGLDAAGKVVVRRRMRRETVVAFCAKLPACVVAMEACCGAHHMGRSLAGQGHEVRLMSPEYVRPYVKAQKNDDRDAEAIAEAATRPTMRFVAMKSEAQLDMQTLHRVRDQFVGNRTSLMNQIRSLLLERGHVVPQGRAKLLASLIDLLDGEAPVLPPRIHALMSDMREQWRALDDRIEGFDAEFAAAARNEASTRRLLTIPGIGALNATALVAPSATRGPSPEGAISRLGWVWCRAGLRPAASLSSSASQSAGANTCARCWSSVRGPPCRRSGPATT